MYYWIKEYRISLEIENNEELFHYGSLSLRCGAAGREHKREGLKRVHEKIHGISPILCGIPKIQPWFLSLVPQFGPSSLPWTHSHCPVCSLATLEVKGGLGSDTVNQRSQPTCIPASLLGISVVVHLVVFIRFSCWLYQFDMVKIGNYLKSTFLFLCPWKPIFLVIRVNIWSLYKLRWCRMWKEEFENHPFVYITLQLLKIWQYHNIPNIMGIFSCKNICIHSITRNSVIYCSTGIIP